MPRKRNKTKLNPTSYLFQISNIDNRKTTPYYHTILDIDNSFLKSWYAFFKFETIT